MAENKIAEFSSRLRITLIFTLACNKYENVHGHEGSLLVLILLLAGVVMKAS